MIKMECCVDFNEKKKNIFSGLNFPKLERNGSSSQQVSVLLKRLKVFLASACFCSLEELNYQQVPTVISGVIHTHEICLCRKLYWVINWQGVRQYLGKALEMG